MKVLFVFSGNNPKGISPIIKTQGESLSKSGLKIDYYAICGKGLRGYAKNILPLRRAIRKQHFDIIHAHNDLCGIVAAISTSVPVVTSLMGSEVYGGKIRLLVIRFFTYLIWKGTIVKSRDMATKVSSHKTVVIPNGVDLDKFYKTEKTKAQEMVGFSPIKRNILFLADPSRPEKNFELAKEAISKLKEKNIELHCIYQVDHSMIPIYLNAADILLLTSKWEGSPNVVKEALACECPVVSTQVGDVEDLLINLQGCFITTNDPADIAGKIEQSLAAENNIDSREKMRSYALDKIAEKVKAFYLSIIEFEPHNT